MTSKKKRIKKPRQVAAALRYDPKQDRAPRVTAKGKGEIAKRILDLAKAVGVPIREDSDLAEILMKIEINMDIPPSLYKVMAEVLAYIYRVNARFTDAGHTNKHLRKP